MAKMIGTTWKAETLRHLRRKIENIHPDDIGDGLRSAIQDVLVAHEDQEATPVAGDKIFVYSFDTKWDNHEDCPGRYWQQTGNTIVCMHCGCAALVKMIQVSITDI